MRIKFLFFLTLIFLLISCEGRVVKYLSLNSDDDTLVAAGDMDATPDEDTALVVIADFYISTAGSDENDGKSQVDNGNGSGPWKSLKMISAKDENGEYYVKPGDFVALKRGDEWVEPDLTNDSGYKYGAISIHPDMTLAAGDDDETIIGAYGKGDLPVINGGSIATDPAYTLIGITGVKNLTIRDLHLIVGQNNYFGAGAIHVKTKKGSITGLKIDGVIVDNSRYTTKTGSGNGSGIWIEKEGSFEVRDIEISSSEFEAVGGNFKAGDNDLTANSAIVIGGDVSDVNIHHNKFFQNYQGVRITGGRDHNISYNLISGTSGGVGIEIVNDVTDVINVTVAGNIITGVFTTGVEMENIESSRVINNSIYMPSVDYDSGNSKHPIAAVNLKSGSDGVFTKGVVRNNIFYGNVTVSSKIMKKENENEFSNNIYYNLDGKELLKVNETSIKSDKFEEKWLSYEIVSDEINANPMFQAPYEGFSGSEWKFCYSYENCGDYRLKDGSPAIDAGKPIDGYNVQDGKPDIGAHEK